MRKPAIWILALTLALPGLASAAHTPDAINATNAASRRPLDARAALGQACPLAVQLPGDPGSCLVSQVTRRVIAGNVAEYSVIVRTGSGPHDQIGLHRVVRESAPLQAIPTDRAVLFAHGDAWGFDAAFLANLETPGDRPDHGAPVYLAEHGIDVWGIDFGWALVPPATTDFSFLQNWGIGRDARDLGVALALARLARFYEGQGPAKIDLLGWSRGGQVGYAYLNAETQVPQALRQVRGFIPVDILIKTNDATVKQAACARAAAGEALLAAGTFQSTTGALFATLGSLAISAPSAPSSIITLFNNRQAAIAAGTVTYTLLPPGQSFVPVYHFAGGDFDAQGHPFLSYTPESRWFHFEAGASPFEPERVVTEGDELICGQKDLPYDDHLRQITVPVLYIGAGGGFGQFGVYSTTLLGSKDVTTRIVSLLPADQRAHDFGHADLWNATAAPRLVWQPIVDWIQGH